MLFCHPSKLTWQVNVMKRFIIEQSDTEFYTPNAGLALVGLALNRYTTLAPSLARAVPTQDVISHVEVLKSYCGLLSEGKSDFVAIEQHRADEFFRESLGNKHVPSEGTMRQRMDEHADAQVLRFNGAGHVAKSLNSRRSARAGVSGEDAAYLKRRDPTPA